MLVNFNQVCGFLFDLISLYLSACYLNLTATLCDVTLWTDLVWEMVENGEILVVLWF